MLWSRFFIPTVKETPADAVVPSHQLGIRAGLIRQVAAGSYSYLPLGYRVLRKIEQIVREEMDAAGAVELHMPALQPLAWWEETGRAAVMGDVLLRIKGSGWQSGVVLGPTHEEVVTEIARAYVNSYKQLPINLYQIQTKFRGEERPKSGVLRTREFLMKDAYSFDADKTGLDASYQRMYDAYCRIFSRCGLPYLVVEAESGPIGGDASHEFMVLTDAGEDLVAITEDGLYAANIERAGRAIEPLPADPDPATMKPLETLHTPDCPGIDDVCRLLNIQPHQMIKTLLYEMVEEPGAAGGAADAAEAEPPGRVRRLQKDWGALVDSSGSTAAAGRVLVVCVRGDHDVNENKLRRLRPGAQIRLMDVAKAEQLGFSVGYVGPHIVRQTPCTLVIDPDARAVVDGVTGANQYHHHVSGFNWRREIEPAYLDTAVVADVRNVVQGDRAPNEGRSPLQFRKAIEVGHVFKLGTRYSDAMGATFLDESGRPKPFIMGCYGIGVNRIMAAAIEAHHDADGIRFPVSIAPFHVLIAALDVRDEHVIATARKLHDELESRGVEVLLDNRDQRPGFKFKDADLIGIPVRITVGRKTLAEGLVELKSRTADDIHKLPPEAAIEEAARRVRAAKQKPTMGSAPG